MIVVRKNIRGFFFAKMVHRDLALIANSYLNFPLKCESSVNCLREAINGTSPLFILSSCFRMQMRAILALVCAIFLVLLAYTDGAKGDIVESNKEHTKKLFDEQNAQKRSKQTSIQERMNEEKQDLDGEKESINHGPSE